MITNRESEVFSRVLCQVCSHQAKAENDQRASEKDQGINGRHQQKIFALAGSEHSLTVLSEVGWLLSTVIENLRFSRVNFLKSSSILPYEGILCSRGDL